MSKIFILEDDDLSCEVYKQYFEPLGYDVTIHKNIKEAVSSIEDKGIDYWDCFICDLKVPLDSENKDITEFNSFTFIEKYLEPCKVIIVSAYSSPEIKEKVMDTNIAALHIKPIDFGMLMISVNASINC